MRAKMRQGLNNIRLDSGVEGGASAAPATGGSRAMAPEAAIAKRMKDIKAQKLKEEKKKIKVAERGAKAAKKVGLSSGGGHPR